MTVPRVFLFGLDGATWKVLDRFMEQGLMPNLSRLAEEGSRGVLNSTIPYVTPVAWASVITGVNPARHGIFGFTTMENREGVIASSFANRCSIRAPTVFDIYRQLDRKVISINMPMTYPPQPGDGTIISGMMTPSRESEYFKPRDLLPRLRAMGIDYRIDIVVSRQLEGDLDRRMRRYLSDDGSMFFDDLRRVTEARHRTVAHLMTSEDWDLFQVNFISADRIQHYLWRHIWEDPPDSRLLRRIGEYFTYMDSIIGDLHSRLDGKAVFAMCSDHGFGDLKGNFHLTAWLNRMGYYVPRRPGTSPLLMLRRLIEALGLRKAARSLLRRSGGTAAKKMIYLGGSKVDWRRTRAYVCGSNGIRINLKGRDQYGTVEPEEEYPALMDEISERLMELRDSRGELVMKTVHRTSELYPGAGEGSPDLLPEFDDDHFYTAYTDVVDTPNVLDSGHSWRQGDHRREGIFLATGPGVAAGTTLEAGLEDVLPTILYIQNQPQSKDFDGRVIEEIFTDRFRAERKDPGRRSYSRGDVASGGETSEDEVIDRLTGLGYI
jgi:predicted AlkP superfamily phosphohydrolase/phosphomutase